MRTPHRPNLLAVFPVPVVAAAQVDTYDNTTCRFAGHTSLEQHTAADLIKQDMLRKAEPNGKSGAMIKLA